LLDPQENSPEYDEFTVDDHDEENDQDAVEEEESDSIGKARQRQKQAKLKFENMLQSALSAPAPEDLPQEDTSNKKNEGDGHVAETRPQHDAKDSSSVKSGSSNPFDDDYVEQDEQGEQASRGSNPFDYDEDLLAETEPPNNPFGDCKSYEGDKNATTPDNDEKSSITSLKSKTNNTDLQPVILMG